MAADGGGSGGGDRHWLADEDPGYRSDMLKRLTIKLAPQYQPWHEPYSQEAQSYVAGFEEKAFSGTNSKDDYIRNISNMLISIEKTKSEGLQRRMQSRSQLQPDDSPQALQGADSSVIPRPTSQLMTPKNAATMGSAKECDVMEKMFCQAEIAAGQGEDQARGGDRTSVTKKPVDRLIDAMRSSSPSALRSAAHSIWSVLSIGDIVPPGKIGTILDCKSSQQQQFGGSNTVNKMKRVFNCTATRSGSLLSGSCMSFECDASDSGSSSEISIKRQKTQNANDALLEEIKSANSTLIDTVISMSGDDGTDGIASCDGGAVIKLSYGAGSLSPTSLVLPTKLFVPPDYPSSSPVLINHEGDEMLRENSSAISVSVDVAFRRVLGDLPEPRSIKETAKAWDACVRRAVAEFAHRHGGGTVSSMLGQ